MHLLPKEVIMDFVIQTPTQIGIHLRSRRKALGLTQAMVASQIGLTQKRLSVLELHPDRLSVKQLLSLASILKLEVVLREKSPPTARAPGEW